MPYLVFRRLLIDQYFWKVSISCILVRISSNLRPWVWIIWHFLWPDCRTGSMLLLLFLGEICPVALILTGILIFRSDAFPELGYKDGPWSRPRHFRLRHKEWWTDSDTIRRYRNRTPLKQIGIKIQPYKIISEIICIYIFLYILTFVNKLLYN